MRAICRVCDTPIPVGNEDDDPHLIDVGAHALTHEET